MGRTIRGVVEVAHMLGFKGNDDEMALDYLEGLQKEEILGDEEAPIFDAIQHYDAIVACGGKFPPEVNEAIETVNARLREIVEQDSYVRYA